MKIRLPRELLIGLVAVILGLLAGAVFMLITGSNPIEGYAFLFKGGLKNTERIGNSIATATPLIFTGLAVAFAFRTGLFNIGASGQMLIGGLCATAVGLTIGLPKALLVPLMLLTAFVSGGFWGMISGFLKARFNVHEVVSTIMLNWIAYWTVYYAVPAYFKGEYLETESRKIPDAASLRFGSLTDMFDGSYINAGIIIALVTAFIIWLILDKTVLGFELKAAGFNKHASEYAGMNVQRNLILSMAIAGGLAGLGGMSLYAGYSTSIQIGVLPTQGFDGIAVSLLGANSPAGVIISALFFGVLHSGKGFMNAMTDIPPQIGETIIATIIYFAATSVLIERWLDRIKRTVMSLRLRFIRTPAGTADDRTQNKKGEADVEHD